MSSLTRKVALIMAFSFIFLFICVGYAALTDTLSITGTAIAEEPDYDDIVIKSVAVVSSTATAQDSARVLPTNVKSTITGSSGQKIVYKITAHNYSESVTYIFAGASSSNEFSSVSSKLTISPSTDSANAHPLTNDISRTHYSGTPIAPGEEFVFYATYTLTGNISAGEILVNYNFKPVIYTVTYLNNNQTYAVDCITDNSKAYAVRADRPQNGSLSFAGWMNANAIIINSFPAGNTNDYTLSAKWDKVYLIIFADADGTVLYEEQFTDSSTKLSDAGQAIVNAKLAELNERAAKEHLSVTWSSYNIASATSDITVKAIYNYSGYLNLVPVYNQPDDGIVDSYEVDPVDNLSNFISDTKTVEVPGFVGGVPVLKIDRITNTAGSSDWNNYEEAIETIVVGEGVEVLSHNSLSYTPNLKNVYLPSTITEMGKNTFSRNDLFGNDKKVITIHFDGTKAEWKALLSKSNSNWDGGLKKGSIVQCSDGYFQLEGLLSLSWKEH